MMKNLAIGGCVLFVSLTAQAALSVDVNEVDQYLANVAAAYPELDVDACAVVQSEAQESTAGVTNFSSEAGYLKVDCSAQAIQTAAQGPGRPGFFARLFGRRDFRGNIDRKSRRYFRGAGIRKKRDGCRSSRSTF